MNICEHKTKTNAVHNVRRTVSLFYLRIRTNHRILFLFICGSIFSFFIFGCGEENTIDRIPPEVKILSPKDGDDIGKTITVTVSAKDNVAVSTVSLFVDDILLENKDMPPYNFVWNSDFWGDGKSHMLSVQATDLSSNVSPLRKIYVDVLKMQKPQVEIISPQINQVIPDSAVVFKWKPIASVRTYKIEIFPDAVSKIPMIQFETTKSEAVVSLREEKTYSWKILPVTIGKMEGKWTSQTIFHRTRAFSAIEGENLFDNFLSMIREKTGGYVLCGSTQSKGGGAILLKYTSNGNLLWKRFFGGTDLCFFSSLIQTTDGGFLLAGIKHEQGTENDIWLVKTDSEGFLLSTKTILQNRNQTVSSISEIKGVGFVVCGMTLLENKETEIFKQFYDDKYELISTQTHMLPREITVQSLLYMQDNGILVVGSKRDFTKRLAEGIIIKFSPTGDEQWKKTFPEAGNTELNKSVEHDSIIYVCGSTYTNQKNQDGFLAVLDMNGKMLWKKTYGGSDNDMANSLAILENRIAFCGQYGGNATHDPDAWMAVLDRKGNIIFSKTYGGKNFDAALSITSSLNGGYACSGYTTSFTAGNSDGFLLIADSTGTIQFPY